MIKKYVSLILSFVFLSVLMPISLAEGEKILFSEDFSSYAQNEIAIPTVNALSGVDTRVISDNGEKVLFSRAFGSRIYLKTDIAESYATKTVMSASIKHSGKITTGKLFSCVSENGKTDFLCLYEDGTLRLPNGKIAGGIPRGKYRTITIRADWKTKKYDVYIDKKCIVMNWKLPFGAPDHSPKSIEWQINSDGENDSVLYLDNIRVYEGERLPWKKSFPHQPDNTAVLDFSPTINIDQAAKIIKNCEFNTDVLDVAAVQNGGSVAPFEDENGIKCVRMYADEKISGTSYFDVTDDALTSMTDYVAEIKFRLKDITKDAYLRFFDTLNTKSGTWRTGYRIDSDGKITAVADNRFIGTMALDEWTVMSVVYDLVDFSASIYLNGEFAVSHPVTRDYFPDMFRVEHGNSVGSVNETFVDWVRVYGGSRVVNSDLSLR